MEFTKPCEAVDRPPIVRMTGKYHTYWDKEKKTHSFQTLQGYTFLVDGMDLPVNGGIYPIEGLYYDFDLCRSVNNPKGARVARNVEIGRQSWDEEKNIVSA